MNYKELNLRQRKKINGECDSSFLFEWEDKNCMRYLLGYLPDIVYSDDSAKKEINSLKTILDNYTPFLTEDENNVFLEEVKKLISDIHDANGAWRGINLEEIKDCMKMHKFCLIMGEGGIGKSFFIKCLEEKLTEHNIEHLCIYGKFSKNFDDINMYDLMSASTKGFVFIVDAINEMTVEGQYRLLEVLKTLNNNPKIRIVITCRTGSMDEKILEQYKEISKCEYKFQGVSFSSALNELLKLPVPDIYKYEDILFSNNALFLLALKKVLSSEQITGTTKLNGVTSITYILEQYIKISIDDGLDKWKCIKKIAVWMYKNKKREIDYNSLVCEINNPKTFLDSMKQNGLMGQYESGGVTYYYFTIDSLTDYLVARSLLEEVSGKTYDEKINCIRQNMEEMYWLKDAFIVCIFDQMKNDYKAIYDILKNTDLIKDLSFNTLLKVHFDKDAIGDFLKIFNLSDKSGLLHTMGGFTDKPFNATNYLYNYYCSSEDRLFELSQTLSGRHFNGDIKNRLKNLLYFLTINNRPDRRNEEAFYFSLLCCAAPNRDVRILATKLLYEIVMRDENYILEIISAYGKTFDFYIKESIIFVLSQYRREDKSVIHFFREIIEKDEYLTAKSISKIAEYLGTPYEYINWNRKNLYISIGKAEIPESVNEILFSVDLLNSDILPFKYMGKNNIIMNIAFCSNKKEDIRAINDYLMAEYHCVRNGECCGSYGFQNKILSDIGQVADIKEIDKTSFIENLGLEVIRVFEYYKCPLKPERYSEDLYYSLYLKCVDIAVGIFYGSLMCNYYTNNFTTYNNKRDSIGYEVYDPLEYGEDEVITSPIPIHNVLIERLGKNVLNLVDISPNKDANWHNSICLTENNILNILQHITYKNTDWIMIAGKVSQSQHNQNDLVWRDEYLLYCCTNKNETIINDGCARYLTIELDTYIGDLRTYSDNIDKPWLCKKIKNISEHSDIFEQTYLVLPPTNIIKFFNLSPNLIDLSWETDDHKKVIICNNNQHSYYDDGIVGSVFMRKDYFDKFTESNTIKYFAFTERFLKDAGFSESTSLHFELSDEEIIKMFRNDDISAKPTGIKNEKCASCKFHQETPSAFTNINITDINDILKEYGIDENGSK